MLILRHLKTLQHVSIIIQIIFWELVVSLLKSLNLKLFKSVKSQLWFCRGRVPSTRGCVEGTVPQQNLPGRPPQRRQVFVYNYSKMERIY